jgi:hypothetical protein
VALAIAASGRFPVKAVAATLGVARSNLVAQLQRPKRPQRVPYRRAEDEAVLIEIRAITDARPTYGYRRVTALLNRARRNAGTPQINHKRVFRLMRLSSMLLQPHTVDQCAFRHFEVRRLRNTRLAADLRHRMPIRTLLQNESLLRVRELRCLHRSPLLPAREIRAENSNAK